ncbi:MAG: VCBS repeat-containing protein [Myxococcales bacterium]|nr:VCBS repeat-containing protein [Myxococcales bacterium]
MSAIALACGDDATGDASATMGSSGGVTDGSATASTTMGASASASASATETGGGSESMSASESGAMTTSTSSGTTGQTTGMMTDGTTSGGTDSTGGSSGTTGGLGPCKSSMECMEGEVCAAGVCVPGEGLCDDYGDCQGDTFCCKVDCLPPGEDQGVCIPYGLDPEGEVNEKCVGDIQIGLFEPGIQCEWTAPPPGDPYPGHVNVLTSPLVADLPNNGEGPTEIIFVTYNYTDGGAQSGYGSSPSYYGVIRIVDGRTCQQIGIVHDPNNKMIAASPPAIGDLDGDGIVEIVTHRASTGVIAFKWNDNNKAYETMWVQTNTNIVNQTRWDGPSIHDLDDDGFPEVISGSAVFAGVDGARLNVGQMIPGAGAGVIPVLADVDGDGDIELIAGAVHRWNVGTDKWEYAYPGAPANRHYAVADFGTPGVMPSDFDPTKLDGIAEIVSVGSGVVRLHTLEGQLLLQGAISGGGPPTIGDFDNDGFPEIAAAGGTYYAVYDLECKNAGPGCQGNYIRWQKQSQDASSATTGSSIFDFEGDGQAEAVYADECYTRVYEGPTGEVLYSAYRSSCTWYENPVVADVDNDQNTEIVVPSNANCNVNCPSIDPIHRGIRCESGDECPSGNCDSGFCRCVNNMECPSEHVCTTPLGGTPGTGNTCRAQRPNGAKKTGIRVLRDRLDRWASSRGVWNQHAYAVTNANDDCTIPKTSEWTPNHLVPGLNNFRQNAQGEVGAEAQPDITSEFKVPYCEYDGAVTTLHAEVCNRGLKTVGAGLNTAFYGGDPEMLLCVATYDQNLEAGECVIVSCDVMGEVMGKVHVEGNDDGMGGKTTVECIDTNNGDIIDPISCG